MLDDVSRPSHDKINTRVRRAGRAKDKGEEEEGEEEARTRVRVRSRSARRLVRTCATQTPASRDRARRRRLRVGLWLVGLVVDCKRNAMNTFQNEKEDGRRTWT